MLGRLANVVLMALLPIALTAPLAVTEVTFFYLPISTEQISIVGSLIALYENGDMLLFYLILCLSVVGPYLRLLLMTYAAFASPAIAVRIKPALELVGRFSLIDIIIISMLVISFRVPEFKLQWGFYLVLGLWVMDMIASWSIWNRIRLETEKRRSPPSTQPRRLEDRRRPAPAPSPAPAPAPTPAPTPVSVAVAAAAATHAHREDPGGAPDADVVSDPSLGPIKSAAAAAPPASAPRRGAFGRLGRSSARD